MHLYADGFNWDTGVEELRRVTRHPLCDRGTALLIYWRGGPGWYAQYSDRAEIRSADEADGYDLSQEIERLIIQGRFATYRFHYDPLHAMLRVHTQLTPDQARFALHDLVASGERATGQIDGDTFQGLPKGHDSLNVGERLLSRP